MRLYSFPFLGGKSSELLELTCTSGSTPSMKSHFIRRHLRSMNKLLLKAVFRIRIRIQSAQWICIQEGQKITYKNRRKKIKKFHV
jgi:hypothetical protein